MRRMQKPAMTWSFVCSRTCLISCKKNILKAHSADVGKLKWISSHLGANPVEDFRMAPITRNRVFVKVKSVSNTSGSLMHGYGFVHSTGQSFPITNNNAVTTMYAPITCTQTSFENGLRKGSKSGKGLWWCPVQNAYTWNIISSKHKC